MPNNKTPLGHRPKRLIDTNGRERLVPLAPGCVRPTGWVKKLADIESYAWIEMIARDDPWNFQFSFYDGSPTPHGGEWAGYWNDAKVGLAILTGRSDLLSDVQKRVDAMLLAAERKDTLLSEHYNGWGAHLMIMSLMMYFEATGDSRVLGVCHRVALELFDNLESADGEAFDGDHPVNMASSCAQIYGYTGDDRMMAMGKEIMARFDAGGLPNLQRLLNDDRLAGHCVNYCEDIRHPADFYISSGDAAHLHASVRGVELTERDHLQVQGVPTGNEPVYGMGPMKETEHCDAVEWSFVGHSLLGATGEAKYADLAETALFNAWAGSRKWDGRSLCYNHAPNQITASAWEGTWLPRQCYSPYHDPQCCNLNSHRAIHPYAFRMWMLTSDGGPAAIYYGDCSLELDIVGAGRVAITEETGYPFDDEVKVTVTPERPARFTMSFRIPTWCQDAEVLLNSEPWPVSTKPGTLVGIDRVWNPGDRVDLRLPMSISLEYCETFEESQFHDPSQGPFDPALDSQQIGLRRTQEPDASSHLVAVRRGPLLYTLCIQPQRIVEPNDSHAEDYIVESILPTEDADPWNVALCLNANHPEDSFEFTHLDVPEDSAPFQHAPAALKCRARIIPNWKPTGSQEKPITSLPEFPVDACGLDVNVLLVPFGCTDIRLTWLPFVL